MNPAESHAHDSSAICKSENANLHRQSTSEGSAASEPASKVGSPKKQRNARPGSAHWSEYTLPKVQLGMKARLGSDSTAHNLNRLRDGGQQLWGGKKVDVHWLPCGDVQLRYCMLCGSPGHISHECDRSNGHKYYRDEKGGGSTTRSLDDNYEKWTSDNSFLSSAFSQTDLNKAATPGGGDDANLRKYAKFKTYPKSFDSSLHRVASPLFAGPQGGCKLQVGESSVEGSFQFSADVVAKRETSQGKRLQKTECCPGKVLPENLVPVGGRSKTTARQGAQMRFRQKLDDSIVVEGDNEREDKKDATPGMCSTSDPSAVDSDESVAIICGTVNGVETTMLLDTGSSISAITETFAQQLKLKTWLTRDTLVVTLANTYVEKYPERTCLVTLQIGDHETYEELNVLPGQIYNVTLGKSWLKRHKAICDYGLDLMRLPGSRPIRMGSSSASLEPPPARCCISNPSFLPPPEKKLSSKSSSRSPSSRLSKPRLQAACLPLAAPDLATLSKALEAFFAQNVTRHNSFPPTDSCKFFFFFFLLAHLLLTRVSLRN